MHSTLDFSWEFLYFAPLIPHPIASGAANDDNLWGASFFGVGENPELGVPTPRPPVGWGKRPPPEPPCVWMAGVLA